MIPGFFDAAYITPTPFVRVGVFLPGITTNWARVHFLLDTGASTTCLHPTDAVAHLGIPDADLQQPQLWPQVEDYSGIGGRAPYFVVPAEYAFETDTGQLVRRTGQIRVAQSLLHNANLESLLGWDVLQHFRLELDWAQRAVRLHEPVP